MSKRTIRWLVILLAIGFSCFCVYRYNVYQSRWYGKYYFENANKYLHEGDFSRAKDYFEYATSHGHAESKSIAADFPRFLYNYGMRLQYQVAKEAERDGDYAQAQELCVLGQQCFYEAVIRRGFKPPVSPQRQKYVGIRSKNGTCVSFEELAKAKRLEQPDFDDSSLTVQCFECKGDGKCWACNGKGLSLYQVPGAVSPNYCPTCLGYGCCCGCMGAGKTPLNHFLQSFETTMIDKNPPMGKNELETGENHAEMHPLSE